MFSNLALLAGMAYSCFSFTFPTNCGNLYIYFKERGDLYMKRFLSVILTVFITLSMIACSQGPKLHTTLYDESIEKSYTAKTDPTAPVVIGQDETCDLVITSNTFISRKHCEISFSDEKIYLADLGSTNGTYIMVDGDWEPVKDAVEISVGDQFMIANTVLTLQECHVK